MTSVFGLKCKRERQTEAFAFLFGEKLYCVKLLGGSKDTNVISFLALKECNVRAFIFIF